MVQIDNTLEKGHIVYRIYYTLPLLLNVIKEKANIIL